MRGLNVLVVTLRTDEVLKGRANATHTFAPFHVATFWAFDVDVLLRRLWRRWAVVSFAARPVIVRFSDDPVRSGASSVQIQASAPRSQSFDLVVGQVQVAVWCDQECVRVASEDCARFWVFQRQSGQLDVSDCVTEQAQV